MVQLTVPSYLKLSCKNIGVFHSKGFPLYFMGSAGIIKNALLIVILVTTLVYVSFFYQVGLNIPERFMKIIVY